MEIIGINEENIKAISNDLKLNDGAYYEWDVYEAAKKKDSSAGKETNLLLKAQEPSLRE